MKVRFTFAVCLLGLVAPVASIAQDAERADNKPTAVEVQTNDEKDLTISPYLWAPAISGSITLGPLEAPVDLSLSDLASGVKIGGMGHVQYDAGPVFGYAEFIGARFGEDQFASFGNLPVRASAVLAETGFGKSFDVPLYGNKELNISPYVGVRYVRLKAAITDPALTLAGEGSWVDPVVGTIAQYQLDRKWSLAGKVDAGGLGISDNEYRSVAIGAQYHPSNNLIITAGYRYTRGIFDAEAGLSANLTGRGPVVGLRYTLN